MAVKRYDGSQWVTVAGKGDQGTSSSIATWVKTASGGETSVSGNDDNSQPLSYTVGQELVFINGALQKRGSDYTATTGNSITGLTALAANDVVTVWTVNAFSVTNAISNTLVDAKGDLIVATGADTPGRLAVGSANQVLTVDSSTGTGLKWATPAAGGKILQVVNTTLTSGNFTTSSTSFVDVTNLNVSITPASTGSRIMVFLTATCSATATSGQGNVDMRFALVRGSTTITEARFDLENNTGSTTSFGMPITLHYLDSPSTTSSTTYKIQVRYVNFSSSVTVQANTTNKAILTVMEVGA
jgi:hypothetical protein